MLVALVYLFAIGAAAKLATGVDRARKFWIGASIFVGAIFVTWLINTILVAFLPVAGTAIGWLPYVIPLLLLAPVFLISRFMYRIAPVRVEEE